MAILNEPLLFKLWKAIYSKLSTKQKKVTKKACLILSHICVLGHVWACMWTCLCVPLLERPVWEPQLSLFMGDGIISLLIFAVLLR